MTVDKKYGYFTYRRMAIMTAPEQTRGRNVLVRPCHLHGTPRLLRPSDLRAWTERCTVFAVASIFSLLASILLILCCLTLVRRLRGITRPDSDLRCPVVLGRRIPLQALFMFCSSVHWWVVNRSDKSRYPPLLSSRFCRLSAGYPPTCTGGGDRRAVEQVRPRHHLPREPRVPRMGFEGDV